MCVFVNQDTLGEEETGLKTHINGGGRGGGEGEGEGEGGGGGGGGEGREGREGT